MKDGLRYRALLLYKSKFERAVIKFDEPQAARLAALIAELKLKGQQTKFFDAAIAATALTLGHAVLTADNDYDRLRPTLSVIKL